MDTLDDLESNAKISDSGYSNSCNNIELRRSHSSKSTLSGSNSSGSSGYGTRTTSGSSNQQPEKRVVEENKNATIETLTETNSQPPDPALKAIKEEKQEDDRTPSPEVAKNGVEYMDVATITNSASNEVVSASMPTASASQSVEVNRAVTNCTDGFSCVISMDYGVVMYVTSSLTSTLGFSIDMWMGRSFSDFIHPRDRSSFSSQISSGLAIPKILNDNQGKVETNFGNSLSTMVCRIRKYRGLDAGFFVKDRAMTYKPFLLKFTFKNVNEKGGLYVFLVIKATPLLSSFKAPNEIMTEPLPFLLRHTSDGVIEYIDFESVSYLGYLPQDLVGKHIFALYHPDDLTYLQQVYETILKEGGLPRSKPYRMMAQNGEYIKLETEWSSFINPWSRKLVFVIGKHHVLEGPQNPDVFQAPDPEQEVVHKNQPLINNIMKSMNEVLAKPAEAVNQHMSDIFQHLSKFMDTFMEEQPKNDERTANKSSYKRYSSLGGVSSHNDLSDTKSVTGTPLSYTQLNYNETLNRYFENHDAFPNADVDMTMAEKNMETIVETKLLQTPPCTSPIAQNPGYSGDLNVSCESGSSDNTSDPVCSSGNYRQTRLTKYVLTKHNTEMEKDLLRIHRENTFYKVDKTIISDDLKIKKKCHLARCNAKFQPTPTAVITSLESVDKKTIKRSSQQIEADEEVLKQISPLSPKRRHITTTTTLSPQVSATFTTTETGKEWPFNTTNPKNPFLLSEPMSLANKSQQMPQMQGMIGMVPMYYNQNMAKQENETDATNHHANHAHSNQQFQTPSRPCMMCGQTVYRSFIVPQMAYPIQQSLIPQYMEYHGNASNAFLLTTSNYKEACIPSMPFVLNRGNGSKEKLQMSSKNSGDNSRKHASLKQNKEETQNSSFYKDEKSNKKNNSDETTDRTDGGSSYSSFYSSFFKTESGSTEESGDPKKSKCTDARPEFGNKPMSDIKNSKEAYKYYKSMPPKDKIKRKMEPPWMEQVCLTSELINKYRVVTKTKEEVLSEDKQRMSNFSQPSLVNEQLGQLYLDLQIEGVAARLTLEEGITSSCSSGEDTGTKSSKEPRKKREYSKLMMIYEEDAPLPPPSI